MSIITWVTQCVVLPLCISSKIVHPLWLDYEHLEWNQLFPYLSLSIFYHQYFAPMRAAILVSDHPQLLACVCYTFYPPPLCHPSVFYYHFSRHCWSGDFIEWRFIPGSWCLRHRPSKNKQQFFSPKSPWRLASYRSPSLSLTFIALLIFTSPSLHFHHLLSFPG